MCTFEPVEIIHNNYREIYGTFNGFTTKGSSKSYQNHDELIWTYKQAFEAMAAMEYLNTNKIFNSPLIKQLKISHQYHGQRIKPTDFKQIKAKCIPSMLKHPWIFEHWTTNEIWQAVIFSMQSNQLRSNILSLID